MPTIELTSRAYSTILFPGKFPDGQLNIPESGNGRSDLLDEWMVEVRWFLKMQVASGPEAGMAYDRLKQTDGQDGVTELQLKRTIRPPNSQSTAEYCASMALAAHVLGKEKDTECQSLAKECRSAAKTQEATEQAPTPNDEPETPPPKIVKRQRS